MSAVHSQSWTEHMEAEEISDGPHIDASCQV